MSLEISDGNPQERELADAIARFLELERAGREPEVEEFVRAHGAIATQLRACLDVLTQLRGERAPALETPSVLGDFRIVRAIGRGGMGIVYEAEQRSLPRRVALKVLAPGLGADAERLARFRREIETTARLRHASIVPVLEAGSVGGLPYYAMPLLEGESLERSLARWRADPAGAPLSARGELVAWIARFVEVARALDTAHRAGVVHRDIKPSNLFLETSCRLVVLDFGLTRSSGGEGTTLTTAPIGTPRYMSPEQILVDKLEVDGRSDQFSLAATLYELLTLRPAFPGDDREAVFRAILALDPKSLRAHDARVPRDVDVILLKALEKEPARRYASCAEFADDLQRFLDYEPVRARPVGVLGKLARRARRNPAAAAAIAVAALAVIGLPLRAAVQAREHERALVASELEAGAAARARLAQLRDRIRALEAGVREKRKTIATWASVDQKAPLVAARAELDAARRERDQIFGDGLVHLMAGLRIAPDNPEVRRMIAGAAFDEFCEAERRRDGERVEALRPLVLADDPGALEGVWRGAGSVEIASDPPGAEVFLARLTDKDALRLAVPMSASGELDRAWLAAADARGPWQWLRLAKADARACPLQARDELLTVCGEPVRGVESILAHLAAPHVLDPTLRHVIEMRRGERYGASIFDCQTFAALEGELSTREVAPVRCTPSDASGTTPLAARGLDIGDYLAVLRLDGIEVRAPFEIRRGEKLRLDISFYEASLLGPEFVYIPAGRGVVGGDPAAIDGFELGDVELPAFFIQRRELTFDEYFDFIDALNQRNPTLAEAHAPRQGRSDATVLGPMWERDGDGRMQPRLLPGFDGSWPVVGVSYRDADAYCRWRNGASGRGDIEFALPTEEEWERASRGVDGRRFAWGDGFDWTYARLGLTAQLGGLLPGASYAPDVSVYGVRDMNGNVREWCRSELGANNRRMLRGGAWGTVVEAEAHLASRGGTKEADYVDTGSGFRLVAHVRKR